jgi:hypothetical protein
MFYKLVLRAGRCALAFAAVVSASAEAYTWGPIDAKVTLIEPSYAGTMSTSSVAYVAISFQVDQSVGGGGCPAGNWLVWSPIFFSDANSTNETIRQQTNVKAILATLQLSIATGTKVRLYGNNAVSGVCQITNVQSLNQ